MILILRSVAVDPQDGQVRERAALFFIPRSVHCVARGHSGHDRLGLNPPFFFPRCFVSACTLASAGLRRCFAALFGREAIQLSDLRTLGQGAVPAFMCHRLSWPFLPPAPPHPSTSRQPLFPVLPWPVFSPGGRNWFLTGFCVVSVCHERECCCASASDVCDCGIFLFFF